MLQYGNAMAETNGSVIERLAKLEQPLRLRGVAGLSIFGSRARGDFHSGSDLDVLIDVSPQSKLSILDVVGLSDFLTDETGIETNIFLKRSLSEDFRKEIASDVRPIF
jgi:uncharacterized protein